MSLLQHMHIVIDNTHFNIFTMSYVSVGIATCTAACTEIAAEAAPSGASGAGAGASRSPVPCLHGQLHRHQEIIERGLRPVMSHPYSTHQLATVNALTEANKALVICRDTLKWIYGKCKILFL